MPTVVYASPSLSYWQQNSEYKILRVFGNITNCLTAWFYCRKWTSCSPRFPGLLEFAGNEK